MTVAVDAKDIDGSPSHFDLNRYPDSCPVCHHHVEPKAIGTAHVKMGGLSVRLQLTFRCPRRDCQRLFIGTYNDDSHTRVLALYSTAPFTPESPEHPEKIAELSPSFIEIYKQAVHAEHLKLTEIAGMGYRKSLEFLVKDFAIKKRPDSEETIKRSFLGNVIEQFIDDNNVKRSAKRATWLGNDESHYVRKWESKDIKDLKALIQLSRNAIDNVLLGDQYENEMSDGK